MVLDTRSVRRSPKSGVATVEATNLREILFYVLETVGCYDACITEAERDGDHEVADFLRELRRQDLLRARMAAELLGRAGAA